MKTTPKFVLSLLVLVIILIATGNQALAQVLSTAGEIFSYLDGLVVFQFAENPALCWALARAVVYGAYLDAIGMNSVVLAGCCSSPATAPDDDLERGGRYAGGGRLGEYHRPPDQQRLVVDFVHIGIGPLRTGIFNLADVAIMGGGALLVLWSMRTARVEEAQRGLDSPSET
jgi:signal peptidase II